MKITWVTRSFLDYRIPVYEAINSLTNNNLTVIYFKDVVPERCQNKLEVILGNRAIGLTGEMRIGGKKQENQTFANQGGLRIPLRPGLLKRVKKTDPDIVLSDGFFQWSYAALLLNAFYKTPHIMCYERTLHTERKASRTRILARKIASNFISGICCNGIETKTYLEKFGFPKEKLFIGNMAADIDGLKSALAKVDENKIKSIREKYNISGLVFLYVGQLIQRKGVLEMLESWNTFSLNKTDINLLLLGDGDQLEEVNRYVEKNKMNSVKVLGRVEYSEVSTIYALSDIFIIPTLEDNWSLVVPEAMSCGLPILSSKYNGCWPELVKPENGWVFDPLDSKKFIKTLEVAIKNKDNWKQMGASSAKIVADFSPEKIAAQIFKTCEKVITDK
jgi:glycosyltransferase involved in cell wall biosynthesis